MLHGLLAKLRYATDGVSVIPLLHPIFLLTQLSDDPEFQQWVNPLISRLVPILLHPKAPRSLHENAAVSIGRIGLMHPTLVAPHLAEFAQAWCQALYEIRDNEEKDSAFRGLCTMVEVNPAGIAKVQTSFVIFSLVDADFSATESLVVLQFDSEMERAVTGAEQYVPDDIDGVQAARRQWVGCSSCRVPADHPRAAGHTLRRVI